MNSNHAQRDACHNCRRQRLKCDRSFPYCLKCIKRAQECLGYDRLLRWGQGIASRGKLVGKTFENASVTLRQDENPASLATSPASLSSQRSSRSSSEASSLRCLTEPAIQDLDFTSRKYLFHFAHHVCRDLVLYDIPEHNHFRELIPLAFSYPILFHIITANSALHMFNKSRHILAGGNVMAPPNQDGSLSSFSATELCTTARSEFYKDALAAKQQAFQLLKSALVNASLANVDVILATVLLFIEFELIDSGRDNWTYHIKGAKSLIQTLYQSNPSAQVAPSPLRSFLISNCLIFDIVGTSLSSTSNLASSDILSTGNLSLLQDAEGNHCSSFPALLLQLIRAGSQLSQPEHAPSPKLSLNDFQRQQALHQLLTTAQSFDPISWATQMQSRSPVADLKQRGQVATAHHAAVCIYLSRILLSFNTSTQLSHELEDYVVVVIKHLSLIEPTDALFTATAWPAFIAGAETSNPENQQWITTRFRELWEVEPWGLLKGALEVLQKIWEEKLTTSSGTTMIGIDPEDVKLPQSLGAIKGENWIGYLRRSGVNWLIL